MSERVPVSMLPHMALAVRQPWAWAIIHGGKDIENRNAHAVRLGGMKPGRIAILASLGMTKSEYDEAAEFMETIGIDCPQPAELARGGIIGEVRVVDIVRASSSPWFFGPRGLVLAEPKTCDFIPASGQLGYFQWKRSENAAGVEPKPWMLKYPGTMPPADRTLL